MDETRTDAADRHLDSIIASIAHGLEGRPDRDALYTFYRRVPLARRIASVVAQDAMRGFDVHQEGEPVDLPEGLHESLLEASVAARIGGGAWLWPYIEGDQRTPLGAGPYDVRAVHVLARTEAWPTAWTTDLASDMLGRPSMLQVVMHRDGADIPPVEVHRSRLIYIPGIRAQPDESTGGDGYDLSVAQVYGELLRDYRETHRAGSRLAQKLSMPVYRRRQNEPEASRLSTVQDALARLSRSMVAAGLMVVYGDDEITWSGPSVSGYSDLTDEQWRAICAEEGIPRTRLLGEQTAGLSNADGPGMQLYADLLGRLQTHDYEPAIRRMVALLTGSDEVTITWAPLVRLDPQQQAQRSLTLAQRDATLAGIGVLLDSEIRARIEGEEDRHLPPLDEAAWQAADIGMIDERDAPDGA